MQQGSSDNPFGRVLNAALSAMQVSLFNRFTKYHTALL